MVWIVLPRGASGLFPALLWCRGRRCPEAAQVPAGRLDRIEDVEEESVAGEKGKKTPFQKIVSSFPANEGCIWRIGRIDEDVEVLEGARNETRLSKSSVRCAHAAERESPRFKGT